MEMDEFFSSHITQPLRTTSGLVFDTSKGSLHIELNSSVCELIMYIFFSFPYRVPSLCTIHGDEVPQSQRKQSHGW